MAVSHTLGSEESLRAHKATSSLFLIIYQTVFFHFNTGFNWTTDSLSDDSRSTDYESYQDWALVNMLRQALRQRYINFALLTYLLTATEIA